MEEKSTNNSHVGNAEGILGNQKVCEDPSSLFVKEEIEIEETFLSEENNFVDNAENCKEIKHENVKIENRSNEESSKEFVPVLVKKDPLHLDQDNEIKTEIKEEQQDDSNEEVLDQEDDSDGSFKDDEAEEEEMNEFSDDKNEDEGKKFKCQHCDHSLKHKVSLMRHIATIHYTNCSICEFNADNVLSLRKHIANVHPSVKNHKCKHCDYITISPTLLKTHVSVHHSVKKHKCKHCDYATTKLSILKLHVDSIHNKIKRYKCNKCKFTTNYISNFKTHIRTIHEKTLEAFLCKFCDVRTCSMRRLQSHINAMHGDLLN